LDYVKKEEKTEAVLSLIVGLERFEEMSRVEDLIEQDPENGKKIFSYISNPVKTQLVSGINCTPETANEEMLLVKNQYNKLSGRQFIHFVQSFSPEENLTPEIAHEIGLKLAEFEGFKGFQMLMATHTDTQHIHNHFVINTVNADTGLKWHKSRQDMQKLKEYSDEICREYGLSVIPWKNQERRAPGEYRAEVRGTSWKNELRVAVRVCLQSSTSRTEFITNMNRLGYKVNWTDTRKYITFTTPQGMRCRNIKLGHEFDKQKMLKQLEFTNKNCDKQDLWEIMDSLVSVFKKTVIENKSTTNKDLWRDELRLAVRGCLRNSTTKEEFITNMSRLRYEVNWEDSSKYVFFKTPNGKKCRSESLGKRYAKENLLKTIEDNKQYIDRRIAHARMELSLELINFLSHRSIRNDNKKRYPLSAALEGQALKDKLAEEKLGESLDWDKGEGYER